MREVEIRRCFAPDVVEWADAAAERLHRNCLADCFRWSDGLASEAECWDLGVSQEVCRDVAVWEGSPRRGLVVR